ncbi:MAG: PEP-CTERM sorting domain-containing protein [Kiritimatiellae bacterium]|nr:PEP-CTERM sorting domain-containing protein [Kiritimatiellia bacterium]
MGRLCGASPIPEPCSVALVLLGVAALGLKRKIA